MTSANSSAGEKRGSQTHQRQSLGMFVIVETNGPIGIRSPRVSFIMIDWGHHRRLNHAQNFPFKKALKQNFKLNVAHSINDNLKGICFSYLN